VGGGWACEAEEGMTYLVFLLSPRYSPTSSLPSSLLATLLSPLSSLSPSLPRSRFRVLTLRTLVFTVDRLLNRASWSHEALVVILNGRAAAVAVAATITAAVAPPLLPLPLLPL
jgi:hypothetical protein